MGTEIITGTSPEILAAYAAHKVNCQVVKTGEVSRLMTVNFDAGIISLEDFPYNHHAESVLPVLRPFSALCTPLPDGTTAAIEVAKIILGCRQPFERAIDFPSDGARFRRNLAEVTFWIVNRDANNVGNGCLTISELFDIHVGSGDDMARYGSHIAAFDYLRRNHFALPINGKPLIEGVDFIPKL